MVKDLLTQEVLTNFREGCGRVLAELLGAERAVRLRAGEKASDSLSPIERECDLINL